MIEPHAHLILDCDNINAAFVHSTIQNDEQLIQRLRSNGCAAMIFTPEAAKSMKLLDRVPGAEKEFDEVGSRFSNSVIIMSNHQVNIE